MKDQKDDGRNQTFPMEYETNQVVKKKTANRSEKSKQGTHQNRPPKPEWLTPLDPE